jgi:hypothetical protein
MQQGSVYKNAMKYGAIASVGLILIFVLFNILQIEQQWISNLLVLAIIIVATTLGTKNYRDKENGGFVGYGRALWSGTMIAFFCGVIVAFFIFIYIRFIDTELVETVLQKAEQNMIDQGAPDAQIEAGMSMMRKIMTPTFMALSTLLSYTIMGLISSLIMAAFVKKDRTPFDTPPPAETL